MNLKKIIFFKKIYYILFKINIFKNFFNIIKNLLYIFYIFFYKNNILNIILEFIKKIYYKKIDFNTLYKMHNDYILNCIINYAIILKSKK